MTSTINIAAALIDYLATQLSIDVILGMPEIGRPDLDLPMGALRFQGSDYGRARARTLANPAPKGETDDFSLYVFAEHENQLLGYVDILKTVKASKTALTVDGTVLTLYWSATSRAEDLFAGDTSIDFVLRVDITVTSNK